MFPCIVKTGWSPPVGSRSEHIQSSTFQLQQCSFSKYMVIYLKPDPPLAFSKTGRISETIFSVFLLLRQFLNCHSIKSKHRHLEFFELHLFDLKTTLDCILCISYRTSINLHPSETSLESIHDLAVERYTALFSTTPPPLAITYHGVMLSSVHH